MDSDFIKNFRNEARTIAKFNHENIVNVYDFVIKACARDLDQRYQNVNEIIKELGPLAEDYGLVQKVISSENRKVATMFLMYKDEHQPELNRMMAEFCEQVNQLGVACKAADFKDI